LTLSLFLHRRNAKVSAMTCVFKTSKLQNENKIFQNLLTVIIIIIKLKKLIRTTLPQLVEVSFEPKIFYLSFLSFLPT
jgi:hypothetical protein